MCSRDRGCTSRLVRIGAKVAFVLVRGLIEPARTALQTVLCSYHTLLHVYAIITRTIRGHVCCDKRWGERSRLSKQSRGNYVKEVKFTFYNEHSVRKRKPSIGERSVNIPDGSGDRCIFSTRTLFFVVFVAVSIRGIEFFFLTFVSSYKNFLLYMINFI